ncbi:MAG TPA: methyltransferase domain-containing protein [Phycisphaerae bacterium]|nr:methyltransferase domain-containing protein [Phycisphaerae bacterium]HON66013.1 methyltransferase domain-containing protein [Phycisphaerae bacterium]HOQ85744.1 methyltransferase domain-containing protein [Phycisphaerae bacterium]
MTAKVSRTVAVAEPVSAPSGTRCPCCRAGELEPFLDLGEVPTRIGAQYATREQALGCQFGRIHLAVCPQCRFVSNIGFSSEIIDYKEPYDNDLGFSSVYQEYERELVERLIREHGLRGKRVVEIGCGRGRFLERLCRAGGNRGIGFDPSLAAAECSSSSSPDGSVELVADYYPGVGGPREADLITCRQVLEHIPDPLVFLLELRATMKDGSTVVFFEVPNFEYVLDRLALWTIVYEHCSYFTRDSLRYVFEQAGFAVSRVYDCFDEQFLAIEARPNDGVAPRVASAEKLAAADRMEAFPAKVRDKLGDWQKEMDTFRAQGKCAVVWGAGARAVCFLNLVPGSADIPVVVDVNPNKAGKFLPGTGHRIVDPASLPAYRPDVVIVMNDIYRDEIRVSVESLGLRSEFLYA